MSDVRYVPAVSNDDLAALGRWVTSMQPDRARIH